MYITLTQFVVFWLLFVLICFGIRYIKLEINYRKMSVEPHYSCPHGYDDWNDCPDCGH